MQRQKKPAIPALNSDVLRHILSFTDRETQFLCSFANKEFLSYVKERRWPLYNWTRSCCNNKKCPACFLNSSCYSIRQWILRSGANLCSCPCERAIYKEDFETLKRLHNLGFPLSRCVMDIATYPGNDIFKYKPIVSWLIKNNCPGVQDIIDKTVESGDINDYLIYLQELGLPVVHDDFVHAREIYESYYKLNECEYCCQDPCVCPPYCDGNKWMRYCD